MENQQAPTPKRFKLSNRATVRMNKYLAEIRKAITNVCELHTHDSNPSMKKVEFEEAYIDGILGQTVTAVSMSLRSMEEALQAQKAQEAAALIGIPADETEKPTDGEEGKA